LTVTLFAAMAGLAAAAIALPGLLADRIAVDLLLIALGFGHCLSPAHQAFLHLNPHPLRFSDRRRVVARGVDDSVELSAFLCVSTLRALPAWGNAHSQGIASLCLHIGG